MIARKIYITEDDFARLTNLVGSMPASFSDDAHMKQDLRTELNRATRVPKEGIPADVITMNSTVVLRDLKTGEEFECTVVFPGQADIQKGRISVLAPIGTALIGYRKGDTIEWKVPGGLAHLKVEEILYQPEAASSLRG
jgi:regulator of nucleoside diphosphate kinase